MVLFDITGVTRRTQREGVQQDQQRTYRSGFIGSMETKHLTYIAYIRRLSCMSKHTLVYLYIREKMGMRLTHDWLAPAHHICGDVERPHWLEP